jgi:tellurite resistance protein TehA-like permease
VVIEPRTHHFDARAWSNVSADRVRPAIVVPTIPSLVCATIDGPVHLTSHVVIARCSLDVSTLLGLIVRALLLVVCTLLTLVVAALLVRPVSLISRTRAGVALSLVAAAVLSIALRRQCDRSAHT